MKAQEEVASPHQRLRLARQKPPTEQAERPRLVQTQRQQTAQVTRRAQRQADQLLQKTLLENPPQERAEADKKTPEREFFYIKLNTITMMPIISV